MNERDWFDVVFDFLAQGHTAEQILKSVQDIDFEELINEAEKEYLEEEE